MHTKRLKGNFKAENLLNNQCVLSHIQPYLEDYPSFVGKMRSCSHSLKKTADFFLGTKLMEIILKSIPKEERQGVTMQSILKEEMPPFKKAQKIFTGFVRALKFNGVASEEERISLFQIGAASKKLKNLRQKTKDCAKVLWTFQEGKRDLFILFEKNPCGHFSSLQKVKRIPKKYLEQTSYLTHKNILKSFIAFNAFWIKKITILDLSNLQLNCFPEELLELTELKGLNLSKNLLKGLPEKATLPELISLNLSHNKIQQLSPSLNFPKLAIIDLSSNFLKEKPILGHCKKICRWHLHSNPLIKKRCLKKKTNPS